MQRAKETAKQLAEKHRHFLLYTLIGVMGVTLDYILFALQVELLHVGVVTANFIAISIAVINNFWLNTKYNFKKTDHLAKRFGLFYAVGFLGIVLSEILIIGFHYGAGMNELVAKLLTLPFVLVFQFLLNKRFSFGDMKQTEQQLRKLFFHWPLYALLVLYAAASLLFIIKIPTGPAIDARNAPDENTHYTYNVEYIWKKKALPVSGKDDLSAYQMCGDRPVGQVPCLYSYTIYPGPNYIASAIAAAAGDASGKINPRTAARAPSFVAGLLFVIFAYAAIYAMLRRRLFAGVLAAGASLIPQVIFVNSYVNLDAHSLAISAILGFALVKFLQNPRVLAWQILFCVSVFGLLPVSKFNYFVLAIPAIGLALYTFAKQRFTKQEIIRFALIACASFLLLASFWYIRNTILYHDPFGQTFMLNEMTKYHPLNQAFPLSINSLAMLIDGEFFRVLFRSFFVEYGSMVYILDESKYTAMALAIFLTGSAFAYFFFNPAVDKKSLRARRTLLYALGLYVFVFLGTLFSVVYNSLKNDFQPQGRYMFPILIPTILFIAYAIKTDKRYQILPFILIAGVLLLFVEGMDFFIDVHIGTFHVAD